METQYTQVTPWLNIPTKAVPYFKEAVKIIKSVITNPDEPSIEQMIEMEYVRIGLGAAFAHAMGYMEREDAQAEMDRLAGAVVSSIEYNETGAAVALAQRAIQRAKESHNG